VVCAVGPNSRAGRAEEKLNIESEATPLQQKLETIANEIGKLGTICAVLTFIVMTIKLIVTILLDEHMILLSGDTLKALVNFLIISITIIVVAVPEGLPLAVTISLAFSVMKMKQEQNLVRRLEASETMGGANEICTDKTGTLTQNRMKVEKVYFCERKGEKIPETVDQSLVAHCVLFNCSARIERDDNNKRKVLGNVSEVGLINYLIDQGVDAESIIREKEDKIILSIPFSSDRKRATTVLQHHTDSDKVRIYCKGAPEIVIRYCTQYVNENGEEVELDDSKKDDVVDNVVQEFAKETLRTLLIAYRDMDIDEYERLKQENNDFKKE